MSKIEQALAKASKDRQLMQLEQVSRSQGSDLVNSSSVTPASQEDLSDLDPRIIAFFSGRSDAAEQYRQLRTKILRVKKLYSHNTFLISSALPGEGKSVTAVSLAITIAQGLQDTVLLVDTDLRRPSIHKLLKMKNTVGLTEYLTGKVRLEDIIYKTKIGKLSVILSGTIPPNPSELISSEVMGKLMAELKAHSQNRIVIFDSPPVISMTDSVVLAQRVDGVVLVAYAGSTPKEAVLDAIQSFSESNVMGIVLNHFDSQSLYHRRYKYKYYYKKGSYGYG